jgi:anhydro-N-acetylmuramic acid kinase
MLVDYVSARLFNMPMDKNGGYAVRGVAREATVNRFLNRKFFSIIGARSAGREDFGHAFGERFLKTFKKQKINKYDIRATAAMLTTESIIRCVKLNKLRFDELILTGGGAKNLFFKNELTRQLPSIKLTLASDYGYSEDFLEAISFAVLANEALCSNRYSLKRTTGAKKAVVLGKICQS